MNHEVKLEVERRHVFSHLMKDENDCGGKNALQHFGKGVASWPPPCLPTRPRAPAAAEVGHLQPALPRCGGGAGLGLRQRTYGVRGGGTVRWRRNSPTGEPLGAEAAAAAEPGKEPQAAAESASWPLPVLRLGLPAWLVRPPSGGECHLDGIVLRGALGAVHSRKSAQALIAAPQNKPGMHLREIEEPKPIDKGPAVEAGLACHDAKLHDIEPAIERDAAWQQGSVWGKTAPS